MQRLLIGLVVTACGAPAAEPEIGGTAADGSADDAVLEGGDVVEPSTACPDGTPAHVDPLRRRAVVKFELGALPSIAIAQSAPTRVYGCSPQAGLVSWDVTDPTALMLDGAGVGSGCNRVWVDDAASTVVTTTTRGVQTWTSGSSPELLASWDADVDVVAAIVAGDRVVVAAGREGIVVLERDGGILSRSVGYRDEASNALSLAIGPDGLVVAEGETGVRTYDLEALLPRDTSTTDGIAVDVVVAGERTVVAALDGIAVIGGESGTAWFPSPGTTVAVAASASTILAADWIDLRQLAVDDAEVTVVGGEPLFASDGMARFSDVAVAGTQAFATDGTSLIALVADNAPAPDIVVQTPRVDFGNVAGDAKTRAVIVLNAGNADLHLCAVDSDIDGLDSDVTTAVVAPGASLPVELTLSPVNGAPVSGNATFVSNDPDQGELSVEFVANPDRVDVGEAMAPFHMVGLDGRSLSSEDLLGSVVLLTYFTTW